MKNSLELLLEHLSITRHRYQKSKEDKAFNIFTIMMNEQDEVGLHSKFIHELLNPNGNHQFGNSFLQDFIGAGESRLQTVSGKPVPKIEGDGLKVEKEASNIDLLIRSYNPRIAIIIENKLFADDRPRQLANYFEKFEGNGFNSDEIAICYLNLWDNVEPSINSLGNKLKLNQINLLSYETDIYNWLEECVKKSAKKPSLRESLVQYQEIIKKITGQDMDSEQTKEIIELLKKDDNILLANQIVSNWKYIKLETEKKFWSDLEEKVLNSGYEVIESEKYSERKIKQAAFEKRKSVRTYGIAFKTGTHFNGYDVCIMIRRQGGETKVFYGIRILVNDELLIHSPENDKYYNLSELYEKMQGLNKSDGLPSNNFIFRLQLNRSGQVIDFANFDESTQRLLNDKYRQEKFIPEAWREIEETVQYIKNLI